MAVRFQTSENNSFKRTSDLLDYRAAHTWMGWVYYVGNGASWPILFSLDNSTQPGSNSQYIYLQPASDVATIYVGTVYANDNFTIDLDTWYHVTVARTSSSNATLYVRSATGALLGSANNTNESSGMSVADSMAMSYSQYGGEYIDGRICSVKIWTTALTVAQQVQELFTIRPSHAMDMYGWYPMFPGSGERARDYSGNGRNWTENGTLTDESPPPVSWGAGPMYMPSAPAAGVIVPPKYMDFQRFRRA